MKFSKTNLRENYHRLLKTSKRTLAESLKLDKSMVHDVNQLNDILDNMEYYDEPTDMEKYPSELEWKPGHSTKYIRRWSNGNYQIEDGINGMMADASKEEVISYLQGKQPELRWVG